MAQHFIRPSASMHAGNMSSEGPEPVGLPLPPTIDPMFGCELSGPMPATAKPLLRIPDLVGTITATIVANAKFIMDRVFTNGSDTTKALLFRKGGPA